MENDLTKDNNEEWLGVNMEGTTINHYGVDEQGLGLQLFEEGENGNLSSYWNEERNKRFRNTNPPGDDENPWEFPNYKGGVEQVYIGRPVDMSDGPFVLTKKQHPILLLFMILVHVAILMEIGGLAWVCAGDTVDTLYNIISVAWIYSVAPIVLIIDSILVNILYERKLSLIFVSLCFPFLYPMKRNKHVDCNTTIGVFLCWGYIIASISIILLFSKANSNYGGIIYVSDETIRQEAAKVMDLDINARRVGTQILQNIVLGDAYCAQEKGVDYVVLTGNGSVYLDANAFVDTNAHNIETSFVFAKQGTWAYELTMVNLGGTKLTGKWLTHYWETVIE